MVRVAIVGCAHGMLDDIYATVNFINEMDPSNPIDLLLCCGDFECMRNTQDLATLACPPKYRAMHSFHQYYKQEKTAPVLTVFIGGNHEASNYLQELHYGGWVAPNIFYLGAAGVINVGGLRIAGLSGIYKQQDYTSGRFEKPPFDNSTMRSIYHVRELEVFQLSHLQQRDHRKLSTFLSHDWPRGIEQYGDVQTLLRRKPFFQQEIQANSLGSPAGEFLLFQLRPQYWFAAHLHVKFAAIVWHPPRTNEDSIQQASENAEQSGMTPQPAPQQESTKFLALDKCLPRREFFQVLDIPPSSSTASTTSAAHDDNEKQSKPLKIMFDLEWLAILRATHHLASSSKYASRVPENEMQIETTDIEWVQARLREYIAEKQLDKEEGEWITDFVKTAPAFGEEEQQLSPWNGNALAGNPQTDMLLELLKLPHVVTAPFAGTTSVPVEDPNEIDLDDEEDSGDNLVETTVESFDKEQGSSTTEATEQQAAKVGDPNEIDIDL